MSAEALQWFKSTYSGDEGGQCVEVAEGTAAIHIRDSKNPEPTLKVTPTTWTAFTTGLK
jgi:putative sterol carrier protein